MKGRSVSLEEFAEAFLLWEMAPRDVATDPLEGGGMRVEDLCTGDLFRGMTRALVAQGSVVPLKGAIVRPCRFGVTELHAELEARMTSGRGAWFCDYQEAEGFERRLLVQHWAGIVGDARGIQFRCRLKGQEDTFVVVAPDPEKSGWRFTTFDSRGPVGHQEFESREMVLRALCGDWIEGRGPPYAWHGQWELEHWESPVQAQDGEALRADGGVRQARRR